MQQMQHQFADWGFTNQASETQKRQKPSGCPPLQIKQKQQFNSQNKKIFCQDKQQQIRLTEPSENDKDQKNVSVNGLQNSFRAHRIFEDNTSEKRKNSVSSFRDDDRDNIENYNLKENSIQEAKNMNQFISEIKQMLAKEQKKIAEFLRENFSNNQQELNNATAENKANEQKLQSIKFELSSSIEKLLQIQKEEETHSLSSSQKIESVSENISKQQKKLEEKIEQLEDQFEQMQLTYKTLAQQQMNQKKGEFETKIQKMFDKFHEEVNLLGDQICYTQQDLSQKVCQKKQQTEEQLNQLNKLIQNNFAGINAQIKQKQNGQELADFFNCNYGSMLLDLTRDNKDLMQQFKTLQQNAGQQNQLNQISGLSIEQLSQKIIECEKNCQKFIQSNQKNLNEWENCQNATEKTIETLSSKQNQIEQSQHKQEEDIYSIQQAIAFMKGTNEDMTKQIEISKSKAQYNQLQQRLNQIEQEFQKKAEDMQKQLKQKEQTIQQLSQTIENEQNKQLSQKKKIFNNKRDCACQTDKIEIENNVQLLSQLSEQKRKMKSPSNNKANSIQTNIVNHQKTQQSQIPQFGQDIKYSNVIVPKLSQFAQYSNQNNQFQSNPEFRWEEYEPMQPNNCQQQVAKELNFDKNPSKIEAMLQQFEDYNEENEKIAVVNSSSSSSDGNNSDGEYHTSSESNSEIDNKDDEMFMPGSNSNQPSSQKPNQIWKKNDNQKESYDDYLKKYEFCITTNRDALMQNQQNMQYQQFTIKNNVYCEPQNYAQSDNQFNQEESNIQYEYEHFYPKNTKIQPNSLAQQIAEHQEKIQEQLKQFENSKANKCLYQMQQEPIQNSQQSHDLQKVEGFLRKRLLYINAISKQGFLNTPQQTQILLCKLDQKRNLKDEFDHFILDEFGNPLNLNESEIQYFVQRQIIQVIQ